MKFLFQFSVRSTGSICTGYHKRVSSLVANILNVRNRTETSCEFCSSVILFCYFLQCFLLLQQLKSEVITCLLFCDRNFFQK